MTRDAGREGAATPKMRFAATYVFTAENQVAKAVLPDGNRFLLLNYGKSPYVMPISDPGEYEIDITLLANGRLPCALVVIDLAHVRAWEALTPENVDQILDQCAARAEGRQR